MAAPATVVIVDDQLTFRAAVRRLIERSESFVLVGDTGDGDTAVALASRERPDLVLVDINLGAESGIDLVGRVCAASPSSAVILLSTYQAADVPAAASRSGAVGYVHKEDLSPALMADVLAGDLSGTVAFG